MNKNLLAVALDVVALAGRDRPADAVLRGELRSRTGISRDDARAIHDAVFAYYRWFGWLERGQPVARQMAKAMELDETFRSHPAKFSDAELRRAIPDWVEEFVEVTPGWLRSLQAEPALWLRARPGQGSALAEKLGDCAFAGDGALADALRYGGGKDLFRTPEFHAGEFELQDLSSQAVGLACAPQPGETWWDACAGEGGKLLHLCDQMRNKGLVWASDRAAWRLQQLKRRAARARLFNYRSVSWSDETKPPTKTKFDGVLVDAPCSGVGTWQRNPHARWTTRPEDVRELAETQKRLLATAAASLKPGGRLIYSVCTVTRTETVDVAGFVGLKPLELANPLGHGKASQLWLWPQDHGGNGMFIAGWRMANSE